MFWEIVQFIAGLAGLIILFRWLDKDKTNPIDYPQDYMG